MVIGKVDYQRSSNHSIFDRFLYEHVVSPPSYNLNPVLLSAGNGNIGETDAFSVGDTYLFASNIVNSLRLTANRFVGGRTGPEYVSWPQLGVKMYGDGGKALSASVTGGFTVNRSGIGPSKVAIFDVSEGLSVVKGDHQIALGGEINMWQTNSYSDQYVLGRATFSGQTTGLGLADFLTGSVATWTEGTPANNNKKDHYAGAYINDTWKINRKLTLTYGIRWEPFLAEHNVDGGATHFDLNALTKGVKSTTLLNAPPGMSFPGDAGFPGDRVMNNRWANFGPRLGLAWDLAGDGRTSIRASAGQFYTYPASYYQVGLSNAPPASQPSSPTVSTLTIRGVLLETRCHCHMEEVSLPTHHGPLQLL